MKQAPLAIPLAGSCKAPRPHPDKADPTPERGYRSDCPHWPPQGPAQMNQTPWIWNLQQLPRLAPRDPAYVDGKLWRLPRPAPRGTHMKQTPLNTKLALNATLAWPPTGPRPDETDPLALATPLAGPCKTKT